MLSRNLETLKNSTTPSALPLSTSQSVNLTIPVLRAAKILRIAPGHLYAAIQDGELDVDDDSGEIICNDRWEDLRTDYFHFYGK